MLIVGATLLLLAAAAINGQPSAQQPPSLPVIAVEPSRAIGGAAAAPPDFSAAQQQAQLTSSNQLDPCQFLLRNITDVEQLGQHEYATLEQCVYYFLASEAAKQSAHAGVAHPLAALPPNFLSREPVQLVFHQITLQHFEMNEFSKNLAIHGYIEVSWKDGRLAWDRSEWKLDRLSIQSLLHVWVPIITAQNFDSSLREMDSLDMRRVEASYQGNVSALVHFSLRTFCDDTDFANFPDDTYKCCYQLEPHINQDIMAWRTDGLPVFTDPKYFRDYGWRMSGTIPTVVQDPAALPQLGFCINLQRSSSALRIELTVPTFICALIFLLTPFLGAIKLQILAKLLVLTLQFLAFQLFASRIAPMMGAAAATPKLLRFHEFAVIMNALSISVSIFLWACGRVRRDLPPWGSLIRASQLVNRVLCALQTSSESEEERMEKGGGGGVIAQSATTASYQRDWAQAFQAIHALAMAAFSLVFLFGYLLLF